MLKTFDRLDGTSPRPATFGGYLLGRIAIGLSANMQLPSLSLCAAQQRETQVLRQHSWRQTLCLKGSLSPPGPKRLETGQELWRLWELLPGWLGQPCQHCPEPSLLPLPASCSPTCPVRKEVPGTTVLKTLSGRENLKDKRP